eukprot:CAMPEP_0119027112 /NCGR_PEP_ID=MMETSP1176-20130426/36568_1 /TAXON_ID=265551 /ORGANISM="Synedropsis recta cf, Strain CCMP1620" /LENGTH=50 /DNA_ID=CAMNT_0006982957 /DNA_START=20 /DNA_END=169 /DNA_ORIENTATION=+
MSLLLLASLMLPATAMAPGTAAPVPKRCLTSLLRLAVGSVAMDPALADDR